MPSLSRCLLDKHTLSRETSPDLGEALDLGDYGTLHIVVTVHTAATADAGSANPTLDVQHAAVNELDRYLPFDTPVSIDLTVAGTTWVHVSDFTRFVLWMLSGTLSTEAVVTVEIIAKA